MNFWAITDKGKIRKQNQDTYYSWCDKEAGNALFVVCDGMGGAKAGNVASEMAADHFAGDMMKCFDCQYTEELLKRLLKEAVIKANRAVYEKSVLNYEYDGMGTTLVAALIKDNICLVINVGDSRAYHITDDGIVRVTRDHSVVEDLIERGEVSRESSCRHPQRNLITRAIGTQYNVAGDIFDVDLKKDDYLLLCSDGLSNVVLDDEIAQLIHACGDPETAGQKLLAIALERGAPDNVTIVICEK